MDFDIGAFRTAFPEFADTTVYPNSLINVWAGFAEAQVRQCVWKSQVTMGRRLFTAHFITVEAQNLKAAKVGGVPGTSGGIANTKTVGTVSVSYDTVSTAESNAGFWNLTTYGKAFIRFARMYGAGAIQL